jgi:hypothetical protein
VAPRSGATGDPSWYRDLYRDQTPCLVTGVEPLHNEWTGEVEDDLIEILYKKQLRYMRASRAKVISGG